MSEPENAGVGTYETGYPTSNLRFVERDVSVFLSDTIAGVRKVRILQQSWFYECHKDGKVERGTEWRDVPLGVE